MPMYLVYPNVRKRHSQQSLSGKWYQGMDLPPGTYWHPRYSVQCFSSQGRKRQDRQILPGDIIELVVVLTDDRSHDYYGLPLRRTRDRLRVLRRVRLTHAYTYEELFQSPLYRQWRSDGTLQAYDVRPLPAALPQRQNRRKHHRRT